MTLRPFRLLILTAMGCTGGSDSDSPGESPVDSPVTASETGCVAAVEGACPPAEEVATSSVTPYTCGAEVVSVDGPGELADGCGPVGTGGDTAQPTCLYPITVIPPVEECDYGRPLVVRGEARLPELRRRPAEVLAPRLDREDRGRLAEVWAKVGLAEAASVEAFHRFEAELAGLGAPEELRCAARDAARDEVEHARLAFGLASAYAGLELGAGGLRAPERPLDLLSFAVHNAAEGCAAETLSALLVAEAAASEADPAVRAVLERIAADEARHAALSWRVLLWTLKAGGPEVEAAVVAALAAPPAVGSGLLGPERSRAVARQGWDEVVRPALAAALSACRAEPGSPRPGRPA